MLAREGCDRVQIVKCCWPTPSARSRKALRTLCCTGRCLAPLQTSLFQGLKQSLCSKCGRSVAHDRELSLCLLVPGWFGASKNNDTLLLRDYSLEGYVLLQSLDLLLAATHQSVLSSLHRC